MEHKQATWASKNVVVATNVEVENPEVEEEVDDGIPTYEELKETCVFPVSQWIAVTTAMWLCIDSVRSESVLIHMGRGTITQ